MSSEAKRNEIAESVRDRAEMYRLLAQVYFKPLSQEQIDALAQAGLAALAADDASPLADGYNDVYRYLRRMNTGTRQELASDFTSVFYGIQTYEGRAAQPIESLYRSDGGLVMGKASGEVYRAFRESRVKVHEGLDLPDDHLSFLFEFMAYLCERIATYVENGHWQDVMQTLDEQRAFFKRHIASWFPRFKAIANKLVATRFYRGWLKITQAFLADEEDSFRTLEEALQAQ